MGYFLTFLNICIAAFTAFLQFLNFKLQKNNLNNQKNQFDEQQLIEKIKNASYVTGFINTNNFGKNTYNNIPFVKVDIFKLESRPIFQVFIFGIMNNFTIKNKSYNDIIKIVSYFNNYFQDSNIDNVVYENIIISDNYHNYIKYLGADPGGKRESYIMFYKDSFGNEWCQDGTGELKEFPNYLSFLLNAGLPNPDYKTIGNRTSFLKLID